jgi:peptide/nickel transport system substrate-binding protein
MGIEDSSPSTEATASPEPPVTVKRAFSFSKWDVLIGVVLLLALTVISWFLFASESSVLFGDVSRSEHLVLNSGDLVIAYDQPLMTYEPTVSDEVTRGYLAQSYEGLVHFDRDFNLKPSLALSWGMIEDDLWEFKLRPDVLFHDGSTFDADDVVASIERAKTHPDSTLQSIVGTIDDLTVIDDFTLQFSTLWPDLTLLNRLTLLPIVPEEFGDEIDKPVGTGPYAFSHNGKDEWHFQRFDDYWGATPSYPELVLSYIPEKFERYEQFLSGEIDVLAQVPPVFVDPLLQMDYSIASLPSLEVNFLLFGWDDESIMRHHEIRDAIAHSFDPEDLSQFTSGYARSSRQFVSQGIFGYNSEMEGIDYDLGYAEEQIDSLKKELTVTFDYPEGLEHFADYVKEQLTLIGLAVELVSWDSDDYATYVASGESDFFFYGWKSSLGDSSDFFASVVHSTTTDQHYGSLNNGRYSDEAVDLFIERIDQNVLEVPRLEQLKALMELVVEEEIIGIPLFEPDTLVAIQSHLTWEPRMDNLILAADIH